MRLVPAMGRMGKMVEAKNSSAHEHWTSYVCLRSGEVSI